MNKLIGRIVSPSGRQCFRSHSKYEILKRSNNNIQQVVNNSIFSTLSIRSYSDDSSALSNNNENNTLALKRCNDNVDADILIDDDNEVEESTSIISSFDPKTLMKKYKYTFNGLPVPTPPDYISPQMILTNAPDIVTSKLEGELPVTYSDIEYIFSKEHSKMEFSCGTVEEFPTPDEKMPQIAFAGRSNVGKSSLLNAIVDSDRLAKVSSTPGHTKRINYFNLHDTLYVVDLPGYGFAEGNKEKIKGWNTVLRQYCTDNTVLRRVFILLDARYGIFEQDCEFMDMLETSGVSYQIILTKCDKVSHEHLCELMQVIYDSMKSGEAFRTCFPYIIPTSSENMLNIQDVRAAIIRSSGVLESMALYSSKQRAEISSKIEEKLRESNPEHPYFSKVNQALKKYVSNNETTENTASPPIQKVIDPKMPKVVTTSEDKTKSKTTTTTVKKKSKTSEEIEKEMLDKKKKKKVNMVGL